MNGMTDGIRIVVADDHPIMRSGVVRVLKRQPKFVVVGEGGSAEDSIRLAEELQPDIILLDVGMPGGGIKAAEAISQRCPAVKIVFLTVFEDEATIAAAKRIGVRGYLLKGVGGSEFVETLTRIVEQDAVVFPSLAINIFSRWSVRRACGCQSADLVDEQSAR